MLECLLKNPCVRLFHIVSPVRLSYSRMEYPGTIKEGIKNMRIKLPTDSDDYSRHPPASRSYLGPS